jgi:3-phenylpropionate/trans-cinnamate dioxygenase ferredoxin subunit
LRFTIHDPKECTEGKMAFVRAANVSDVPLGHAVPVEVEGEDIALCNVAGEIYAVANLCTHDGGPLGEGHLVDHAIECPRHGAQFDVKTGQVRSLPAIIPIGTFPVRIDGEEIYVDVE